jgi:hypothetical protein
VVSAIRVVRDQPGRDPGVEHQRERDARPPVVHRRHRVVEVSREADACRDRLPALLEVRPAVTGRDDDAGGVQPLDRLESAG